MAGFAKKAFGLAVATAVTAVAHAAPGQALTLISDSSSYSSLDEIDWSTLGPDGTILTNPFQVLSQGGSRTATVSQANNQAKILTQSTTWQGNFTPGEVVLWNQGGGALTIAFSQPVSSAATSIQALNAGSFEARIEAFDSGSVSLGSFLVGGMSDNMSDGSALFLGVRDVGPTIASLRFSVPTSLSVNNFAIGTLQIQEPVPAPMPLLGAATALGWARRLRRRGSLHPHA